MNFRVPMTTTAAAVTIGALFPAVAHDADNSDVIEVWGERLEETLAQELADYGSRVEVIDFRQIQDGGYFDASQVLQNLVPGLYLAPKNGAFDYVNVSLQGSRTKDVLWLVDGVRISNRLYNSTTPLDTIPAHMIERIEVLKGGQGLFYGTQAVGGVINVITKNFSTRPDGALSVGADTNEGLHFNGYARSAIGPHHIVIYASHDEADGFQPFRTEDYQPSATDRERGYEVTTFGAKYGIDFSDALRFSATYQHTDAKLDFASAEDRAISFNERNEEILSAKIDWAPTDRLDLFVKAYWHDWDSNFTRIDNVLGLDGQPTGELVTRSDRAIWQFDDYGVNVLSQYAVADNIDALVGYDFQKYGGRDDEFLIGQQEESVHAPFAQVRMRANIFNGARLAAGVRHNAPSDGQSKTVWNVSGEVDLTEQLFARTLVGTAFRLPSAYELYVIDPCCETGNPNLVGETSFNAEIAFGGNHAGFFWEIIGFHRNVEDLISIDYSLPAYPNGFLVNTDDEIEVLGAEIILGIQLTDAVRATLDYTHTSAETKGSNEQITDVPRDTFKALLDWSPATVPVGVNVSVNYVGDVFDSVGGGVGRVEHGNYAVVDLAGHFFLDSDRRYRIGARLENVFDEDYATQVRRVRRDVDGTSYGADSLGVPRTFYVTFTASLQ